AGDNEAPRRRQGASPAGFSPESDSTHRKSDSTRRAFIAASAAGDSSSPGQARFQFLALGGPQMLIELATHCRRHALGIALSLAAACACAPLAAQGIQTIDPDSAIDGDLAGPQPAPAPAAPAPGTGYDDGIPTVGLPPAETVPAPAEPVTTAVPAATVASSDSTTYKQDDLIGAAEGVFGKGAEGLARLIEDVLAKQG